MLTVARSIDQPRPADHPLHIIPTTHPRCFLAGDGEKNVVQLGPYRTELTCYSYNVKGKKAVGSTFPGQAPLTQGQAATKVQAAFRGLQIRRQYSNSSHGSASSSSRGNSR